MVMKTYLKNGNSKDQALEKGAWTSRVYTYHNLDRRETTTLEVQTKQEMVFGWTM